VYSVSSGTCWIGGITETLSEEDTEDDATGRAFAGGVNWTAWAEVTTAQTQARSFYEARTGFSFAYQEAEYRFTSSSAAPSVEYVATFNVYRRAYGGGAWTLYATGTDSATSDGSGNLTISGAVPNTVGWETYIDNPVIVPVIPTS
jgi:hypothetical protein